MINVLGQTYILATRLENRDAFTENGNFEQKDNNFKSERPRKSAKMNWKFKSGGLFKLLGASTECSCH